MTLPDPTSSPTIADDYTTEGNLVAVISNSTAVLVLDSLGALEIHARAINDEPEIACAEALAALAREDVPDEVVIAFRRTSPSRETIPFSHPSIRD